MKMRESYELEHRHGRILPRLALVVTLMTFKSIECFANLGPGLSFVCSVIFTLCVYIHSCEQNHHGHSFTPLTVVYLTILFAKNAKPERKESRKEN